MANLSILSGVEFYHYDVEVYDKVLLGTIKYKNSQIDKFKKVDKTFFENKSFYGINRVELVKEFIKYLSKFDNKVDKDSFLLNDVVDKRIKKGTTYINDTMIFMASPKQYDAQAQAVAKSQSQASKESASKEVLDLDMEYKDKLYKVHVPLDDLGIGSGSKLLYHYSDKILKSNVESYLKSLGKIYDVQLHLKDESPIQAGKLLIDVIVHDGYAEGFVDVSHLNISDVKVIKAQGKDKQELLDNMIQQLKTHKLTGKLNWGNITDNTNKGGKEMATNMTAKDIKALVKKLAKHIQEIGLNEDEIDGRVLSMIPNIQHLGVGNLGGKELDLGYILPWKLPKTIVKMNKFATDYAETHKDNIVIKEVGAELFILDYTPNEITIEINANVVWINTFFGSVEHTSYPLAEEVVKIEVYEEDEDSLNNEIYTYLQHQGFKDDEGMTYSFNYYQLSFFKTGGDSIHVLFTYHDKYMNSFDRPILDDKLSDLVKKYNGDYWADGIDFTIKEDIGIIQSVIKDRQIKDVLIRKAILKQDKGVEIDMPDTASNGKNTVISSSSNLLLDEFIKKIAARKNVTLSTKIDKDTPFLVSFDAKIKGFKDVGVYFENNGTKYRANIVVDAPFIELQAKTMQVYDILAGQGFNVTQEGLGITIRNSFNQGDITIILELVKLLEALENINFKVKHSDPVSIPNNGVQDLGKIEPAVEPENREVERTYKKSKVSDPEHKAQLERMKAYIKKIADIVDADNDFALRFLEEPKEFQKYKLPTVGVGLFYYGDKSATELEQNALYKKVYRGRGLSILRKFFKTTDLNGEKCLLVLFVDAQYAKETKAKLIKESFENNTQISINGKLYTIVNMYENKFAIETIAGIMYIDYDSNLIDLI